MPPDWPARFFAAPAGFSRGAQTAASLAATRRHALGPSLSLSYSQPLHIIRGWRQHLYDADGRAYLDCVNNVAHVGHCHPRVVEAAARQMALLNTNTRYLTSTWRTTWSASRRRCPSRCAWLYLVCSGSEANELALRLARAHTGGNRLIVVDTAYHGNTNALVEISPYKFNGPGGRGKPPHVHVVPMPDVYRGPYRGADAGARYAQAVADTARGPPAWRPSFANRRWGAAAR